MGAENPLSLEFNVLNKFRETTLKLNNGVDEFLRDKWKTLKTIGSLNGVFPNIMAELITIICESGVKQEAKEKQVPRLGTEYTDDIGIFNDSAQTIAAISLMLADMELPINFYPRQNPETKADEVIPVNWCEDKRRFLAAFKNLLIHWKYRKDWLKNNADMEFAFLKYLIFHRTQEEYDRPVESGSIFSLIDVYTYFLRMLKKYVRNYFFLMEADCDSIEALYPSNDIYKLVTRVYESPRIKFEKGMKIEIYDVPSRKTTRKKISTQDIADKLTERLYSNMSSTPGDKCPDL